MRYFTSDLHLGHARIAEFCGRPYGDVETMNQALIANINAVCGPGDELWILGDFAMGKLSQTLPLAEQFNARTVLVAGNHDRVHPSNNPKTIHRHLDDYLTVFDTVYFTHTELTLSDGTTVDVSHFPRHVSTKEARSLKGETHDPYAAWRPNPDSSNWLICGHVHDAYRQTGTTINVGVDAWDGEPLSEIDIIDLIHEGPTERPAQPWTPRHHGTAITTAGPSHEH